jgi:hypothetical protein
MKRRGLQLHFALLPLLLLTRPGAAGSATDLGRTAPGAAAPPPIAVFESPVACRWLTAASITHLPISGDQLEVVGLPAGGVLVVPLYQVRTDLQARRIADFAARGGKLLAIYWGPIVRSEAQGRHPVYTLGPVLGVRPFGWRGVDPIRVRPGDRPGLTDEILDLRLARGPLIRVEPLSGAMIAARWAPVGRRDGMAAGEGTLAVSAGPHLYLAVDLFAPQNDTAEGRQFFLWALDQLAPGAVYSQARERAGAAMAAVIRAETALAEAEKARPDGDYTKARDRLKEAREHASRAKQAAATDRFFDAAAGSVRAIALAEEVMKLLGPLAADWQPTVGLPPVPDPLIGVP